VKEGEGKVTFKDDNSSHCCHHNTRGSCGLFCPSVVSEDSWGPWRPPDPHKGVQPHEGAEQSQQFRAGEQARLTPHFSSYLSKPLTLTSSFVLDMPNQDSSMSRFRS